MCAERMGRIFAFSYSSTGRIYARVNNTQSAKEKKTYLKTHHGHPICKSSQVGGHGAVMVVDALDDPGRGGALHALDEGGAEGEELFF
jgi:hypothetical protein